MTLRELYESLTLELVEQFVADGREEDLSLDFKTVNGSELRNGDDKRNLAISLSGFANSAGGVLVWGVGTQKNATGQDAANRLQPIDNAGLFVARLHEFTPIFVTPIVSGVGHRAIERPDGTGFAATLVPESDVGPHMALNGLNRYYKRSEDRFYPLQHFDVADMFGRRQRAALELYCSSMQRGSSGGGPEGSFREIRIILGLKNRGRASAVAPYVRLEVQSPFKIEPVGITSTGEGARLRLVAEASVPPASALVGSAEFMMHPKVEFQVAQVSASIWGHEEVPECEIRYSVAALDTMIAEDAITITASEIARALQRAVEPGRR